MFLVGGGILSHGIELLHHAQLNVISYAQSILGNIGEVLAPLVFDGVLGVVAGLVIVLCNVVYTRLFKTDK